MVGRAMPPDEAPSEEAPVPVELPFVRAFEVEGDPGLGGAQRLELDRRKTALVGLNGAGKSVLMTSIDNGADEAVWAGRWRRLSGERRFRAEIEVPAGHPLAYEYTRRILPQTEDTIPSEGQSSPKQQASWRERCWELDSDRELWRVSEGQIFIGTEPPVAAQPGVGLLSAKFNSDTKAPIEAEGIISIPARVALISAGVLRIDPEE